MNTTRRAASAAVLLGALVLTAACGSNGAKPAAASGAAAATAAAPSATGSTGTAAPATSATAAAGSVGGLGADAIMAKALTDSKTASSVHITSAGDSGDGVLDLLATTEGCHVSIKESGNDTDMVQIGGQKWVLLDADTMKAMFGSNSAAGKALVGKYVKVTKDDPTLTVVASMCNPSKGFFSRIPYTTGLTRGPSTTVNGVAAVTLRSAKGETVLVSDTAHPLILRVVTTGSDSSTVDFGDYNTAATVTAPPAAQVISIPGM